MAICRNNEIRYPMTNFIKWIFTDPTALHNNLPTKICTLYRCNDYTMIVMYSSNLALSNNSSNCTKENYQKTIKTAEI